MDDLQIEIAKQEFKEKAENFKMLVEYQEKFLDFFLKVKLALVAFVGVIFAIIFNKPEKFSSNFLFIFLVITFLIFLSLIIELRKKLWDLYGAIKRQDKRTKLAKIRYIAILENLPGYGRRAEEILVQDDNMTQAMHNKESISELIRYEENIFWKVNFYFWAVLFTSIPILLLLSFLKII